VVDTNVAMVADGAHSDASAACVAASARALQGLMTAGHLFVDDGGLIVQEYRATLGSAGPPSPGRAFLRWVLTHEWAGARVTRVVITAKDEDPEDFHEVPPAPPGVQYDRSDRKFLAVAAGHARRPAILQALDSKWWGWREALSASGVAIHFLCPDQAAAKYVEKMGRS
jgi:hypothetical protein